MKIGILREEKIPIDRRVPLLPEQCIRLSEKYTDLQFIIQPSPIRCIADQTYEQYGLEVREDLSDCEILLGVKEVPSAYLIADKTYLFFSHTIKAQAYNRNLLQSILAKNIRLIDYECLTDAKGKRLVAFGRFAGIVGAYNAILTFGHRYRLFHLRPAYRCRNIKELWREFRKVKLPAIKIAVTGQGKVGRGVQEVLDGMQIRQVSPQEFLERKSKKAVYALLSSQDYYRPPVGEIWSSYEFHRHPGLYEADFLKFAQKANLLITAHFWHPQAEPLFTREDILSPNFKIKVIADITCDVEGSIPTTLKVSTVENPSYDYNPEKHTIDEPFQRAENITVMAVDNLPTELPWDASQAFGQQLSEHIFPAFMDGDSSDILRRATIAENGMLTPHFNYLNDFVSEKR